MRKQTAPAFRGPRAKFELHRLSSSKLIPAMRTAFADSISRSFSSRSLSLVGLPGGHSLDGFYTGLGALVPLEHRRHLFFFPVDERAVSASSHERNGPRLQQTLCDCKLANPNQVLLPDAGAKKNGAPALRVYGSLLSSLAPDGADLLIFGVGEDGHIASLFPQRKELEAKGEEWLEVADAPKPPPHRISIPPASIRRAKEVWLVFRGKEKQTALKMFLDSQVPVRECPAKLVLAGKHLVRVWTDILL